MLARRLITNGEWREFIGDGGYDNARLWLSDGWAWVRQNSVEAPLYWRRDTDGEWMNRVWSRWIDRDGSWKTRPARQLLRSGGVCPLGGCSAAD